ncbi:hypothetical protein UP06_17170 [Bradyrhizobium sp. LTSP857]|nr:hypothetical protein UP06_17170 [Bradyrhizobium sp. LTSP857]
MGVDRPGGMPILIKGAAQAMQTERSQAGARTAQGWFAQQKGGRECDRPCLSFRGGSKTEPGMTR